MCEVASRFCALVALVVVGGLLGDVALADHLTMTGGKVYEGEILQERADGVTFRLDHGVITVGREFIASIDRVAPSPVLAPARLVKGASSAAAARIPSWLTVTRSLAGQRWATNLKQIPSTVIDEGVMRAVPYSSFRCGEDYEVNIYGDPDAPAAVEIGVYRSLLNSEVAKSNCVAFLSSLMGDSTDAAIARVIRPDKDLVVRGEVTIEITPPSDPDAYGGWWLSVYSVKKLDAARASNAELAAITVPKQSAGRAPSDNATDWSSSDMQSARSSSSGTSSESSSPGNRDHGRVYVRGYTRSNGTYVAPYTRSSPGSGGGGHGGGHR